MVQARSTSKLCIAVVLIGADGFMGSAHAAWRRLRIISIPRDELRRGSDSPSGRPDDFRASESGIRRGAGFEDGGRRAASGFAREYSDMPNGKPLEFERDNNSPLLLTVGLPDVVAPGKPSR